MQTLIIGGSSGLGLALAKTFSGSGDQVIITGRKNPAVDFAEFRTFDLSINPLNKNIEKFISSLPPIDRLIYAAGYYQEGLITDLTDEQIEDMINVCGRGLIYFSKYLLTRQNQLAELITITSTSAWTPRRLEPIYNFAKAGAGHYSNALAEDGRIKKVMQVGPSGMVTNLWAGTGKDTAGMLDPSWVAGQIMKARQSDYRYKYIRILREPSRVEEVETRP